MERFFRGQPVRRSRFRANQGPGFTCATDMKGPWSEIHGYRTYAELEQRWSQHAFRGHGRVAAINERVQ